MICIMDHQNSLEKDIFNFGDHSVDNNIIPDISRTDMYDDSYIFFDSNYISKIPESHNVNNSVKNDKTFNFIVDRQSSNALYGELLSDVSERILNSTTTGTKICKNATIEKGKTTDQLTERVDAVVTSSRGLDYSTDKLSVEMRMENLFSNSSGDLPLNITANDLSARKNIYNKQTSSENSSNGTTRNEKNCAYSFSSQLLDELKDEFSLSQVMNVMDEPPSSSSVHINNVLSRNENSVAKNEGNSANCNTEFADEEDNFTNFLTKGFKSSNNLTDNNKAKSVVQSSVESRNDNNFTAQFAVNKKNDFYGNNLFDSSNDIFHSFENSNSPSDFLANPKEINPDDFIQNSHDSVSRYANGNSGNEAVKNVDYNSVSDAYNNASAGDHATNNQTNDSDLLFVTDKIVDKYLHCQSELSRNDNVNLDEVHCSILNDTNEAVNKNDNSQTTNFFNQKPTKLHENYEESAKISVDSKYLSSANVIKVSQENSRNELNLPTITDIRGGSKVTNEENENDIIIILDNKDKSLLHSSAAPPFSNSSPNVHSRKEGYSSDLNNTSEPTFKSVNDFKVSENNKVNSIANERNYAENDDITNINVPEEVDTEFSAIDIKSEPRSESEDEQMRALVWPPEFSSYDNTEQTMSSIPSDDESRIVGSGKNNADSDSDSDNDARIRKGSPKPMISCKSSLYGMPSIGESPKKLSSARSSNNDCSNVASGNVLRCGVCDKMLPTIMSLQEHMLVHTNLKPHFCVICKKSFRHTTSFLMHLQVHKGTRQVYKCNICAIIVNGNEQYIAHWKERHPSMYDSNAHRENYDSSSSDNEDDKRMPLGRDDEDDSGVDFEQQLRSRSSPSNNHSFGHHRRSEFFKYKERRPFASRYLCLNSERITGTEEDEDVNYDEREERFYYNSAEKDYQQYGRRRRRTEYDDDEDYRPPYKYYNDNSYKKRKYNKKSMSESNDNIGINSNNISGIDGNTCVGGIAENSNEQNTSQQQQQLFKRGRGRPKGSKNKSNLDSSLYLRGQYGNLENVITKKRYDGDNSDEFEQDEDDFSDYERGGGKRFSRSFKNGRKRHVKRDTIYDYSYPPSDNDEDGVERKRFKSDNLESIENVPLNDDNSNSNSVNSFSTGAGSNNNNNNNNNSYYRRNDGSRRMLSDADVGKIRANLLMRRLIGKMRTKDVTKLKKLERWIRIEKMKCTSDRDEHLFRVLQKGNALIRKRLRKIKEEGIMPDENYPSSDDEDESADYGNEDLCFALKVVKHKRVQYVYLPKPDIENIIISDNSASTKDGSSMDLDKSTMDYLEEEEQIIVNELSKFMSDDQDISSLLCRRDEIVAEELSKMDHHRGGSDDVEQRPTTTGNGRGPDERVKIFVEGDDVLIKNELHKILGSDNSSCILDNRESIISKELQLIANLRKRDVSPPAAEKDDERVHDDALKIKVDGGDVIPSENVLDTRDAKVTTKELKNILSRVRGKIREKTLTQLYVADVESCPITNNVILIKSKNKLDDDVFVKKSADQCDKKSSSKVVEPESNNPVYDGVVSETDYISKIGDAWKQAVKLIQFDKYKKLAPKRLETIAEHRLDNVLNKVRSGCQVQTPVLMGPLFWKKKLAKLGVRNIDNLIAKAAADCKANDNEKQNESAANDDTWYIIHDNIDDESESDRLTADDKTKTVESGKNNNDIRIEASIMCIDTNTPHDSSVCSNRMYSINNNVASMCAIDRLAADNAAASTVAAGPDIEMQQESTSSSAAAAELMFINMPSGEQRNIDPANDTLFVAAVENTDESAELNIPTGGYLLNIANDAADFSSYLKEKFNGAGEKLAAVPVTAATGSDNIGKELSDFLNINYDDKRVIDNEDVTAVVSHRVNKTDNKAFTIVKNTGPTADNNSKTNNNDGDKNFDVAEDAPSQEALPSSDKNPVYEVIIGDTGIHISLSGENIRNVEDIIEIVNQSLEQMNINLRDYEGNTDFIINYASDSSTTAALSSDDIGIGTNIGEDAANSIKLTEKNVLSENPESIATDAATRNRTYHNKIAGKSNVADEFKFEDIFDRTPASNIGEFATTFVAENKVNEEKKVPSDILSSSSSKLSDSNFLDDGILDKEKKIFDLNGYGESSSHGQHVDSPLVTASIDSAAVESSRIDSSSEHKETSSSPTTTQCFYDYR